MAGHVTNLATKLEDPMPIRSWFMSYNVSHCLALKMRTRPLRMRRITWPVNRGSKQGSYRAGTHRNAVPVLFFWSPERRSGPFRFSCVYNVYTRFLLTILLQVHLNESDKFALFGSKMPSASGGGASPPWPGALPLDPAEGTAPRPPYRLALAIFLAFRFFFLQETNPGSKTITYLESPTPICLFTIQLLLGYDDD